MQSGGPPEETSNEVQAVMRARLWIEIKNGGA